MVSYELREQYITPDECEPYGLRHIVELSRLMALYGHAVDAAVAARPLEELGDIDPDRCCGPCKQIHRGAAGRALDEDWHKEMTDRTGAGRQSRSTPARGEAARIRGMGWTPEERQGSVPSKPQLRFWRSRQIARRTSAMMAMTSRASPRAIATVATAPLPNKGLPED